MKLYKNKQGIGKEIFFGIMILLAILIVAIIAIIKGGDIISLRLSIPFI